MMRVCERLQCCIRRVSSSAQGERGTDGSTAAGAPPPAPAPAALLFGSMYFVIRSSPEPSALPTFSLMWCFSFKSRTLCTALCAPALARPTRLCSASSCFAFTTAAFTAPTARPLIWCSSSKERAAATVDRVALPALRATSPTSPGRVAAWPPRRLPPPRRAGRGGRGLRRRPARRSRRAWSCLQLWRRLAGRRRGARAPLVRLAPWRPSRRLARGPAARLRGCGTPRPWRGWLEGESERASERCVASSEQ